MFVSRDAFRSPRRGIDDDINEGFDELASVGHPEDTDITDVFESTGINDIFKFVKKKILMINYFFLFRVQCWSQLFVSVHGREWGQGSISFLQSCNSVHIVYE